MTVSTGRSPGGQTATLAYAVDVGLHRVAWGALRARISKFIWKVIDDRPARLACGGLETMSDRDLRDIGLRRADVEFMGSREYASLADPPRFYSD